MPRQERALRTRRLILEAAAAVFDECGYEGTSTTEILARSGLTRGALYHHFESKEAIASALVDIQREALVIVDRAIRLQSAIDLTFEFGHRLQTDPVLRASVRLTVEQTSFKGSCTGPYGVAAAVLSGLLYQAEQRGELLPGLNPAEVTQFIVAAFTGMHLVSNVYSERRDLIDRVSSMWRFLLPGVAAPGLLAHLRTLPPPPEPEQGSAV